ncbi:MAG: hypothetical protein ACHQQS_09785 [Thermoanaerobaculales bacterium]
MRIKRYLLACLTLFLVALVWNGVVHLVLLRQADLAVQHLLRPDFASKAWLSLVVTAGMVMLFAWGYGRFARDASVAEGARFALFFGVLAGLLVDLNQYVLYPFPAWVAACWFAGGLVEFQLYALLLGKLFPPVRRRDSLNDVS